MTEHHVKKTRYIFITGGVVSSLGKGIAASSLAALLQARGFCVRMRKLDPYLNVDPGTMSPFQHGEVFVTDDGAETDLDLGHYERFTSVSLAQADAITSGRVYQTVLNKERRGDYLGGTVQVIPHVTDMIKDFIHVGDGDVDFMICEIGGTVGDIEGLPFMEAIRQTAQEDPDNVMFIHLTLLPYIPSAGELKTKPTQHSVKELRSIGIQPHLLLCRCDRPIPSEERRKIALFCNVRSTAVIEARDVRTIYEVPLTYYEQGFDREVLRHFKLPTDNIPDLSGWRRLVDRIMRPAEGEVNIAIVGKYTGLLDAYKSLQEALTHGGIQNNVRVNSRWIDAEQLESEGQSLDYIFSGIDAILVPGGFGERGSEGKIKAVKYAREKNIPYFGICFGMQMAVIETARHLAHLDGASSTEFADCSIPLIGLMTQWQTETAGTQIRELNSDMGGTMRLGAYPAILAKNSMASDIYGTDTIIERHRHRYEVNMTYRDALEKAGLLITGMSPDGLLPEIVERHDHPWFLAVQFHPELKSRPFEPHPLFVSFVKAALDKRRGVI